MNKPVTWLLWCVVGREECVDECRKGLLQLSRARGEAGENTHTHTHCHKEVMFLRAESKKSTQAGVFGFFLALHVLYSLFLVRLYCTENVATPKGVCLHPHWRRGGVRKARKKSQRVFVCTRWSHQTCRSHTDTSRPEESKYFLDIVCHVWEARAERRDH